MRLLKPRGSRTPFASGAPSDPYRVPTVTAGPSDSTARHIEPASIDDTAAAPAVLITRRRLMLVIG